MQYNFFFFFFELWQRAKRVLGKLSSRLCYLSLKYEKLKSGHYCVLSETHCPDMSPVSHTAILQLCVMINANAACYIPHWRWNELVCACVRAGAHACVYLPYCLVDRRACSSSSPWVSGLEIHWKCEYWQTDWGQIIADIHSTSKYAEQAVYRRHTVISSLPGVLQTQIDFSLVKGFLPPTYISSCG